MTWTSIDTHRQPAPSALRTFLLTHSRPKTYGQRFESRKFAAWLRIHRNHLLRVRILLHRFRCKKLCSNQHWALTWQRVCGCGFRLCYVVARQHFGQGHLLNMFFCHNLQSQGFDSNFYWPSSWQPPFLFRGWQSRIPCNIATISNQHSTAQVSPPKYHQPLNSFLLSFGVLLWLWVRCLHCRHGFYWLSCRLGLSTGLLQNELWYMYIQVSVVYTNLFTITKNSSSCTRCYIHCVHCTITVYFEYKLMNKNTSCSRGVNVYMYWLTFELASSGSSGNKSFSLITRGWPLSVTLMTSAGSKEAAAGSSFWTGVFVGLPRSWSWNVLVLKGKNFRYKTEAKFYINVWKEICFFFQS